MAQVLLRMRKRQIESRMALLCLGDTFSLLPDFVPPANQTCTWEKLEKGSELMTAENQDVPDADLIQAYLYLFVDLGCN